MRIYIESTIPSYVVARPARDLLQAARQQLTQQFSFCGPRLCPEDQPQRVEGQNRLILRGPAAAGRDDTAALRAK